MARADRPFASPAVAEAFAAFPDATRSGALALRALIFETAAAHPEVGALQETLKWGQPSYLTPETKAGSTLRIGQPKAGGLALYAHCQTTIISDFAALFGADFTIEGSRAVHLDPAEITARQGPLTALIASGLTYHLR